MGNLGQEDTNKLVKLALDRGVNFIDTADVYSRGESETLLGNALKGVREEIVLATKVRLPMSDNFNRSGATRVNILRGVESSLKRLQTDHVDLYQVHGWDSNTPFEETLRTLDDLVRQGKVRYIGMSNLLSWQAATALGDPGAAGAGEVRHRPDVLQPGGPRPGARVPVLRPVPRPRHPGLEPPGRRLPGGQVQPLQPGAGRHALRRGGAVRALRQGAGLPRGGRAEAGGRPPRGQPRPRGPGLGALPPGGLQRDHRRPQARSTWRTTSRPWTCACRRRT